MSNRKIPTIIEVEAKEILLVNPDKYGIKKSKAFELIGNLPLIKSERAILEEEYKKVVILDINDKETSKKARKLRLEIKDNRTKGIEKWHKDSKELFLRGGQFVDAIKNLEIGVNQEMEASLEVIENHFETQERIRKENLKNERVSLLEEYKDFVPFGLNFGEMSQEEFDKVLNGAKLQHEQKIATDAENERIRIETEKEAERVRLQKEEDEKAENERIRLENAELQKALDAQKAIQDKLDAERKIAENKERIEREENEAKLKAEREENERLQKAIQDKVDADLKAERDAENARIARENQEKKQSEKLRKAPIKKQIKLWVEGFEIPKSSVDNEVTKEIVKKFEAFKSWALLQTENI
jgi:hypothetical protein